VSSFDAVVIEVEARVKRGAEKAQTFGWVVTIPPHDDPEQAKAMVTEACRRLRDETQGKVSL